MTRRPATCAHRWPAQPTCHWWPADPPRHRCALIPGHLRARHVCACGAHSQLDREETTDAD